MKPIARKTENRRPTKKPTKGSKNPKVFKGKDVRRRKDWEEANDDENIAYD